MNLINICLQRGLWNFSKSLLSGNRVTSLWRPSSSVTLSHDKAMAGLPLRTQHSACKKCVLLHDGAEKYIELPATHPGFLMKY